MKLRFIGNGGHAKSLKDICEWFGFEIVDESENKVLAFGGLHPKKLEERYRETVDTKDSYPCLIHPSSALSNAIYMGDGVQVMPNVVINRDARIGAFCIINSGAVIEHDVVIGIGCHIAPSAVVLGGAKIGDFCMIGANSTIIQGTAVPDRTLVKAGTVYK